MARKSRKNTGPEIQAVKPAEQIYHCALYARISVENEQKRESDAIGSQLPLLRDCAYAFAVGGIICTLGQILLNQFTGMGLSKQDAASWVSISLVALSALLTGLSFYDDIAKYGGAGTLVPIMGFANAVAAPAVEFQTEGFILGVGAKMFTIAGPVIVYGLSASVVYGIIYWLCMLYA